MCFGYSLFSSVLKINESITCKCNLNVSCKRQTGFSIFVKDLKGFLHFLSFSHLPSPLFPHLFFLTYFFSLPFCKPKQSIFILTKEIYLIIELFLYSKRKISI